MSSKTCERCGALPPLMTEGPFKGSRHELDYCAHCSKDLCETCLAEGRCRENPGGTHHQREVDCDACAGTGIQDALDAQREDPAGKRKCLDCDGTGVVLK